MSSLAIVTPTFRSNLTAVEFKRISLTLKMNSSFQHFFVIPKSLDIKILRDYFPESRFKKYNDAFFLSKYSYSDLMLSPFFYQSFNNFENILICQLDAFLLRNIEPVLNERFIYLGSAWNPSIFVTQIRSKIYFNRIRFPSPFTHELQSGNGGLSLRNTTKIFEILKLTKKSKVLNSFINENRGSNEDILIVYLLKKFGIPVIPRTIANKFFIESTSEANYNFAEIYGFHALNKFNPELEKSLLL
jgi:hypothetical protein